MAVVVVVLATRAGFPQAQETAEVTSPLRAASPSMEQATAAVVRTAPSRRVGLRRDSRWSAVVGRWSVVGRRKSMGAGRWSSVAVPPPPATDRSPLVVRLDVVAGFETATYRLSSVDL
jgi:hypothetical protein